jgi:hypothetical protein
MRFNARMRSHAVIGLLSSLAVACAAAEPAKSPSATATPKSDEPKAPSDEKKPAESAESNDSKPAVDEGLPITCAKGSTDKVCLPPNHIAKGLCNEDFPTVALAMFAKGTPWTRGYSVTQSVAWNASGGASSNERMNMYEEIIILRQRIADTGGIQVSGSGTSYDVLRWDGSCVTLQEGEFVFDNPPKITNARVVLKRLEPHVRDALKEADDLRKLYLDHRKECKGVTVGEVSKECEKLDTKLSDAVAAYVRNKGGVPAPKKLPKPR